MSHKPEQTDRPEFGLTFPEQEAAFVKKLYPEASVILEYGSGGSTVLAAECGKPCLSVESDALWAKMLTERLHESFDGSPTAKVFHVDIGPTRDWGYPQSSTNWEDYWKYPLSVWDSPGFQQPDLVLIDGRMRTACFAAAMLKVQKETTVLFDDYKNRIHYHDVERYAQPDLFVGRMAKFTLRPHLLSMDVFADIVPWFFSVR